MPSHAAAPATPAPWKPADGITYTAIDGAGDRKLFRCEAYRTNLFVDACAKRYRLAQKASGEEADRVARCARCPIGMAHAGEEVVYRNELFGINLCPRCRRGSLRMISNRICIGCYNRQREFRIGQNAKGTPPITIHLEARRVGVVLDYDKPTKRYIEVQEEYTKDALEIAIQVMRVAPGRVAFREPVGRPAVSTAQLAQMFGTREKQKPPRGAAAGGRRQSRRTAVRAGEAAQGVLVAGC
jgi:hypothetical protein